MDFSKIISYRAFIRSYLEKRALKGRGEIGKLAQFMRVHPTFVSQVLASTKDFNMEQSFAVADYLELTKTERKFFLLLVQKDRAGTKALKNYYTAELEELKSSMLLISKRLNEHRTLSDEDRAVFYSSWLYSAIRLYCSVGSGKKLEEVCDQFHLGRRKALIYLDFLLSKDLVSLENERYQLGSLHTHLPSDSPFVVRHHMNWRTKALQRHESIVPDEIAFTAPMSISKRDFLVIREKLLACIKDSIEVAKASEAEDVAFLNIDWLWVEPTES